MKIESNKVVLFHYVLRDAAGAGLESSHDGDPVAYLHGTGSIIPGLEEAMAGKQAGDRFTATVSPEKGYGERVEGRIQRIPVKHLLVKKNARLVPGMVVGVQTDHGVRQATVVKPGKFTVDVDTNHPWAGKSLIFEIEIVEVRAATEEELAHGHAHGAGGHHH